MRVFIVTFALLCAMAVGTHAQQTNSSNDEPKEKKTKAEPTTKAEKEKNRARRLKNRLNPLLRKNRNRPPPNQGPIKTKRSSTFPRSRPS